MRRDLGARTIGTMPNAFAAIRPEGLAGHVDLIWSFQGPTQHRLKRVFPSGRFELLISSEAHYRHARG